MRSLFPFIQLAILIASLACSMVTALALDITLDPRQPGRIFEGIGAASAGASSRLLIDYPESQRSQILDYLFKPGYGASLQHLKVEIGGGVNSTDGTEPTHQLTRTDLNFNRGYEWWLMQQARARNPNIILDCLAWGAPGWIGNGNYYSQDMCNYIVSFLNGAQTNYGLTINFTGTHNESTLNTTATTWMKLLRSTLDASGLQNVQLVAADEWGGTWNIVTNTTYGLLVDPALSNAIARVGAHYPGQTSPSPAQSCGKTLWSSEDGIGGSTWAAAMKLAMIFNRNYISGKITATEIWSPITSYYDILAAADSGLMRANTPWSGNYNVAPAIWAAAHTTQFAAPGWNYLEGGASALLPSGGSVVTLVSTNQTDYSIVVETSDATVAQTVTFHLTNGLSSSTLNVWLTTQNNQFINVGQVALVGGVFSYMFQPACIYTLTTTTGQGKGSAVPPPPTPFPLPFKDGFESYASGATPKYFCDQAGTFAVFQRTDGQGQCLRQISPQAGLRWTAEWQPYTLIGDASWANYDVSADVLIESNNGVAFVQGRVGSVPGFSDALPRGYWFALNNASSQWELHSSSNLLATGPATIQTNTWHNLRLAMQGAMLRCYVDGALVTNILDYTYSTGMAGLGCGGWYGAQFDNFVLRPDHGGDIDLALTATASASSIWQNDPTYAATMVNDGNPTTRWNSAYPTLSNEWLELDFPAPTTFNHTTYSQYGGRITSYAVQHWNGSTWITDVNGGAMGTSASDSFSVVTASKVRLLMTGFSTSPSIYEFSVYNDAAPPNLALSATASASSIWSSGYTANYANDNDLTTRWNAAPGATNGEWLELDWPAPVNFNRTVLWQFGARVTAYKIQHWNGSGWIDDMIGGPLGASGSDSFPAVTSVKARFLVVTATNIPSIWEFQVFNDPPPVAPVSINEWMMNNTSAIADPAGGYQPWFELYNAGSTNVSLAGYYLGGVITNLFQFQIPSGYSIPPGDFLLVWTDGQTAHNSGGSDLHANFSLQQSQVIALFNTTGQLVDEVSLSSQAPNISSGSIPDGDSAILNLVAPTPRQSNNQVWFLPPVSRAVGGTMSLNFSGIPFASHRILSADTLTGSPWTTLMTVSADALGAFKFADTNAVGHNQRFYRAVSP